MEIATFIPNLWQLISNHHSQGNRLNQIKLPTIRLIVVSYNDLPIYGINQQERYDIHPYRSRMAIKRMDQGRKKDSRRYEN